jgi:uncharacterized protein YndB with AHSA1/START domain
MRIDSANDSAQLHRHLDASPELVFAAFADAALVRRWLTPGPEVRLDVLAYEFRVGGGYRFAYHVPGGAIMHVNGVFQRIEPPSRLVFTWNIEPPDEHAGVCSEVHVTIRAAEAGSELHIDHRKLSRAGAPERHAEGWRGAVDQLAALARSKGERHDAR